MNNNEKALARNLFQNKIYKADGQAFEDIFTAIMNYAEPDFQPIRPWGNIGDRKNDGYIESKGIFFQVFAPEDTEKSYPNIIKKLENDFKGLFEKWSPVKKFYFVVNDKYKGVNADCEQAIQKIKKEYNLKDAGFKTAKDLENLLFSLADDQILKIIGFLPDPNNITLDYSILNEIISHLMSLPLQVTQDSPIIVPDWDQKIQFNGLEFLEKTYLNNGSLQVGVLDDYLNNQSNFFAEELKNKIREFYIQKKDEHSGSKLFWEMVNTISPRIERPYNETVIILMAKYFETCDIFEEPQ